MLLLLLLLMLLMLLLPNPKSKLAGRMNSGTGLMAGSRKDFIAALETNQNVGGRGGREIFDLSVIYGVEMAVLRGSTGESDGRKRCGWRRKHLLLELLEECLAVALQAPEVLLGFRC